MSKNNLDVRLREALRYPNLSVPFRKLTGKARPRFVFRAIGSKGYLACTYPYTSASGGGEHWIAHLRNNLPPVLSGQDLRVQLAKGWANDRTWRKLGNQNWEFTSISLERRRIFNKATLERLVSRAQAFHLASDKQLILLANNDEHILHGLCQFLDYLVGNYRVAETPSFSSLEGFPPSRHVRIAGLRRIDAPSSDEWEQSRSKGLEIVELELETHSSVQSLTTASQAPRLTESSAPAAQPEATPEMGVQIPRSEPALARTSASTEQQPAVLAQPQPAAPIQTALSASRFFEMVDAYFHKARKEKDHAQLHESIRTFLAKGPGDIETSVGVWLEQTGQAGSTKIHLIGIALSLKPAILLDPASLDAASAIGRGFDTWPQTDRFQFLQLCLMGVAAQKQASALMDKWLAAVFDPIESAAHDAGHALDPSLEEVLEFLSFVAANAEDKWGTRAVEAADLLLINRRQGLTVEVVNRAIRAAREKLASQHENERVLAQEVEKALSLAPALTDQLLIEAAAISLAHETDVRFGEAIDCLCKSAQLHDSWKSDSGPAAAYDEIARGQWKLDIARRVAGERHALTAGPHDERAAESAARGGFAEQAVSAPDDQEPTRAAAADVVREAEHKEPRWFVARAFTGVKGILRRGEKRPPPQELANGAIDESERSDPKS